MPDWNHELRTRLAPLKLHPTREAEIVDELSQHLDLQYEELRRSGHSEDQARRLAVDELLGPEALAAYMRPLRRLNPPAPVTPGGPRRSLLRDLAQDLALCARLFPATARLRRRRHPHAGARHRRQQRHLRAGRCHLASPAAHSRARARGDDRRTHVVVGPRARLAQQPARFRRAQPQLRDDRRLHGRRGRHGDGRGRRHRGNGRRASG